jgi:cellulose synthase (UDP-forming)
MQVLRMENPLFGRGLSFGQRVAFMTTLFAWFDSWRMLAYMVIPVAVIFTAASPIAAPASVFGPLFVLTLGAQFVALRLLARGHYPPVLSMLFEVLRMPAVLPATLTVLRRDTSVPFRVTPKGRAAGRGAHVPRLHLILAAASTMAIAWLVLTALGVTSFRYEEPGAAVGAGLFAAINLGLLIAAISRIRAGRFAGERRASVRFDTRIPGTLSGTRAIALDLSLTGAQVVLPKPPAQVDPEPMLELDIDGVLVGLQCVTRRVSDLPDGAAMVGIEFTAGQRQAVRRLALAMFRAEDAAWRRVAGPATKQVRRRTAARRPTAESPA